MIFFSSFLGGKVIDNTSTVIGKVDDAIINVAKQYEFPPVVGVIVRVFSSNQLCFLKINDIEHFGEQNIVLRATINRCDAVPTEPEYIHLKKAVLDKQIVDLEGIRVVRVNDLQFGQIHQVLSLIAIDISTLGLLRRVGVVAGTFTRWFKPNLLEWKEVHILENKLQLNFGLSELVKLHPADIANIIEKLNLNRGSLLLQALDKETAARVLEEVQPDLQKLLVKHLGVERAADMMAKMSTDELVDLIKLLPSQEAQNIVQRLPIDKKMQHVKKILEYDEDTAGGLMSTEYLNATPATTKQQVIEEIKRVSANYRSIQYVYVTDVNNQFLGVASLRSLIVAEPNQTMQSIMKPIDTTATVTVHQSMTAVAEIMTKYNLMSVAVLDKSEKMLGVITVDDIMRNFLPHA
ncbi:MAG: CBS domain-containing protein [Patescibacteria group bacterium]|jgi:CBS domain-containing protein/sporulation protein YlmC with PRC-barrel domain